jgi:hypothetical protein
MKAHIHAVIVAATDGGPVSGIMLGAGHYCIQTTKAITLKTLYPCAGNLRAQVGVLAGAFHNPAPAWVAGNVNHRGKGPMHAARRSFGSGYPRRTPDSSYIPAGRFAKRDREGDAIAVDYVLPKKQGYF